MKTIKSTCEKWYQIQIFKFGIISVLNALEYFENCENYEECQKIINAIKLQSDLIGEELSTRLDEKTIKDVAEAYKKFNITSDFALKSSKYYATLIIKEAEELIDYKNLND